MSDFVWVASAEWGDIRVFGCAKAAYKFVRRYIEESDYEEEDIKDRLKEFDEDYEYNSDFFEAQDFWTVCKEKVYKINDEGEII